MATYALSLLRGTTRRFVVNDVAMGVPLRVDVGFETPNDGVQPTPSYSMEGDADPGVRARRVQCTLNYMTAIASGLSPGAKGPFYVTEVKPHIHSCPDCKRSSPDPNWFASTGIASTARWLPWVSDDGFDIFVDVVTGARFTERPSYNGWDRLPPRVQATTPYLDSVPQRYRAGWVVYGAASALFPAWFCPGHLLRFVSAEGFSWKFTDVACGRVRRPSVPFHQVNAGPWTGYESYEFPPRTSQSDLRQLSLPRCSHHSEQFLTVNTVGSDMHMKVLPDGEPGPVDGKLWRWEEDCNGTRCTRCWPQTLHSLAPQVVSLLEGGDWDEFPVLKIQFAIATAIAVQGVKPGSTIGLISMTKNRLSSARAGLPAGPDTYLVLAGDEETYTWATSIGHRVIKVRATHDDPRATMNYRPTAAACIPVGLRVNIVNARSDPATPASMEWYATSSQTCVSAMIYAAYPTSGGAVSWMGGHVHYPVSAGQVELTRVSRSYGADEYLFAAHEDALNLWRNAGPWMPTRNTPPPLVVHHSFRLHIQVGNRSALWFSKRVTRAEIVAITRFARSLSTRIPLSSLWSALTAPWDRQERGRFTLCSTRDTSAVRSNMPDTMTAAGMIRRLLGPVVFFPIGSRGDVVPVEAIARHLAFIGLETYVCPLTSPAEGRQMLADLEGGQTIRGAPLFLQGAAVALSSPGTTVGITEMPGLDITYSLQPPRSVVRSPRFNLGVSMDLVLSAFFGEKTASFRIGSYQGANWVPRSHDGTNFLKYVPRRGPRPHKVGIVWGSSSLPIPHIPGAVPVPEGDHLVEFQNFETVHTHGGAGTVQTAAAAGCRVRVETKILDRDYRTPHDAGHGTYFGADPDRALLALAAHKPLIYILYARRGFTHALDALHWAIWAHWNDILWANFVLLSQLYARAGDWVVGPSFISTLFGSVIGPILGKSVFALLLTPLLSNLFEAALEVLEVERVELARRAFSTIMQALTSGLGLGLVTAFGLTPGILMFTMLTVAAPALKGVYSVLVAFIALPALPDDPTMAIIRFNLSLAGATPVLHVGLIDAQRTQVYELRFTHGGGFFGDESLIALWPYREAPGWVFEFRTLLPWEQVRRLPALRGQYSLFFNCQVALSGALGSSVGLLGAGGLVLLLGGLLAGSVISFWLILLLVPYLFIMLLPDMFGITNPFEAGADLREAVFRYESWMRVLLDLDIPFLTRTISIANTPMAGFNGTRVEHERMLESASKLSTHSLDQLLGELDRAMAGLHAGLYHGWQASALWLQFIWRELNGRGITTQAALSLIQGQEVDPALPATPDDISIRNAWDDSLDEEFVPDIVYTDHDLIDVIDLPLFDRDLDALYTPGRLTDPTLDPAGVQLPFGTEWDMDALDLAQVGDPPWHIFEGRDFWGVDVSEDTCGGQGHCELCSGLVPGNMHVQVPLELLRSEWSRWVFLDDEHDTLSDLRDRMAATSLDPSCQARRLVRALLASGHLLHEEPYHWIRRAVRYARDNPVTLTDEHPICAAGLLVAGYSSMAHELLLLESEQYHIMEHISQSTWREPPESTDDTPLTLNFKAILHVNEARCPGPAHVHLHWEGGGVE